MCEICLHNPCLNGCPNKKSIVFYYCNECGAEICEGDEYVSIDGNEYCLKCIEDMTNVAEALDQYDCEE